MGSIAPSGEDAHWHARFEATDAAETARLAGLFASALAPGDAVALFGDLGAGKTTFTRAVIGALARAAGQAAPEVPSPTFTLVQTYDFPEMTAWHFDLYRIAALEEALELGLEEAMAGGVSLIEWPERLGPLLPRTAIIVTLGFAPARSDASEGAEEESRIIEIVAPPPAAMRMKAAFARTAGRGDGA